VITRWFGGLAPPSTAGPQPVHPVRCVAGLASRIVCGSTCPAVAGTARARPAGCRRGWGARSGP